MQRAHQHELAVKHAENLLHEVKTWDSSQVSNYYEILANIYSMLGLSNLELGNYTESLEAHQAAYDLGQENNLSEVISHSMDNMGRVFAKKGDYDSAIKMYVEYKKIISVCLLKINVNVLIHNKNQFKQTSFLKEFKFLKCEISCKRHILRIYE